MSDQDDRADYLKTVRKYTAAQSRLIGSAYEGLSERDRGRYEELHRAMARDVRRARILSEREG